MEGKEEKIYKKTLFITSRVHPGESQASHMVHGVIDFLLSDEPEAEEIRDKFVVKVIPMLNPDGVIHGNYRVNLLGVDLNRRWKKPSKYLHPTIYYTKQIIKYFNEKSRQPGCDSGGVVMCCDFHGHSRNMDLFMYSCNDESSSKNLNIRSIPVGVDRMIPVFNLKHCKFALEKDKENTARIVIYKELGILSSYTLESTFYGSEFLKRQKPGAFLLPKDQQEEQAERYGIGYGRTDISVNEDICFKMGADFMRGINYASKKKPILQYWFRHPPKNIVELFRPGGNVVREGEDPDIDPALLELEKNWKPLGHVDQTKHIGIGDRFNETAEPNQPRTPPADEQKKGRKIDKLDIALLDKQKKQKRANAKKKRKEQAALKAANAPVTSSVDKDQPPNNDLLDILEPGAEGGAPIDLKVAKKKKKKRAQSPIKKSSSIKKMNAQPHKAPADQYPPNTMDMAEINKNRGMIDVDKLSASSPNSSKKKIPIVLREPGNTFQDEMDSDSEEANELRVSQIVFSKDQGELLS